MDILNTDPNRFRPEPGTHLGLASDQRGQPSYELESELARTALYATTRDPDRKLAWVNSVCVLFLLIGVSGSKPAPIRIKPLPPIEEATAVIVEPLPPPPPTHSEQQPQEQNNDQQPDTPQVVVVTPDAPSINFSVPTIGNLVVPNAIAQAPPVAPLKRVAPLRAKPSGTQHDGRRRRPPAAALSQNRPGAGPAGLG